MDSNIINAAADYTRHETEEIVESMADTSPENILADHPALETFEDAVQVLRLTVAEHLEKVAREIRERADART